MKKKPGRNKLPPHLLKAKKEINFTPEQIKFLNTRHNASEDIRNLLDGWEEFKKFQKENEK